ANGMLDPLPGFALYQRIRRRYSRRLGRETLLRPVAPQMVDRQVGSYSPCPGTKVAIRAKLVPRAVNAPKSFHGQILGNTWVAHNTHCPGVDFALKLAYQRLERIDLAMREPLEQIHELLYPVLRDTNTQVTSFLAGSQAGKARDCYSRHAQVRVLPGQPSVRKERLASSVGRTRLS